MKNADLERRALLRGMFAAGCAAVVSALYGCQKQEPQVGETAPEPAPPSSEAGGQAQVPATIPEVRKVSKTQVAYQDQPKGSQKCSDCQFFIPESSTCKQVDGDISPQGWCTLWSAKTAAGTSG
jgi:hypothetical protein